MKGKLLFAVPLFALAACVGGTTGGGSSEADSTDFETDSQDEEVLEARLVTGFVGTGTSMNMIELVSAEASDTLWLELDDETVRDATLEVGREIVAVVTDEPDGSLRVLATLDAEEE